MRSLVVSAWFLIFNFFFQSMNIEDTNTMSTMFFIESYSVFHPIYVLANLRRSEIDATGRWGPTVSVNVFLFLRLLGKITKIRMVYEHIFLTPNCLHRLIIHRLYEDDTIKRNKLRQDTERVSRFSFLPKIKNRNVFDLAFLQSTVWIFYVVKYRICYFLNSLTLSSCVVCLFNVI